MCGVVGLWQEPSNSSGELQQKTFAMISSLVHRGPDDLNVWVDEDVSIALGHSRLSILDLSPQGSQPKISKSEDLVVSYNGEIYNHLDLRDEICSLDVSIKWLGTSDTETLLAAIDIWGLELTLKKCKGMFAIALWDIKSKKLYLARDRMGEKPLYYGYIGKNLVFASELKALHLEGEESLCIDKDMLSAYLEYGYVPEKNSIYSGIKKVPPGCIITFETQNSEPLINSYWSVKETINKTSRDNKFRKSSFKDKSKFFDSLLNEVVASQMISDVPLGSFLSGGIDSSLVTSLMQNNSSKSVKTFSIGFEENDFNESIFAEEVANHLGTDHTSFIVREEDAIDTIKDLPKIYDEPFADSSQIPTLLLCRLAKKEVTVALTGDGGDEIFGGYNRYLFNPKFILNNNPLSALVRKTIGITASGLHNYNRTDGSFVGSILKTIGLPPSLTQRIGYLGQAVSNSESTEDLYNYLTKRFVDLKEILLEDNFSSFNLEHKSLDDLSPQEWMMAMDALNYLPGDILVKVDRAAMSTSLETRTPFLDGRILDYAYQLQLKDKITKRKGKLILRDILNRYVPAEMIDRPKQGFSIPIDRWLRGSLKSWAEDLLSSKKIKEFGILDPAKTSLLWKSHLSGTYNNGERLWTILMLQSWLENRS